MRSLLTVALLFGSNIFMTWAWYGHLRRTAWTIPVAIGVSWLIALPEYMLQVPANRLGHVSQGGPFSASQLKVLQEAITLVVFIGFAFVVLKERPRINEYIAFVLIFSGVAVAMIGRDGRDERGLPTPRQTSSATAPLSSGDDPALPAAR